LLQMLCALTRTGEEHVLCGARIYAMASE